MTAPTRTPYTDAMDDLHFSDEQLELIVEATMQAWENRAASDVPDEAPEKPSRPVPRISRRAAVGIGVAAAVSAGCAGAAIAGSMASGVSIVELLRYLFDNGSPTHPEDGGEGSDDSDLVRLASQLSTPVGASATVDGVTVTVESVLGDRYIVALIVSIARDDGTPLGIPVYPGTNRPQLSPSWDLYMPGSSDGSYGGPEYYGTPSEEDSVIRFVQVFSGNAPVIGQTCTFRCGDIGYTSFAGDADSGTESEPSDPSQPGDSAFVTVAPGEWSIDFIADYEDLSVDLLPDGPVFVKEYQAEATLLSISPLGISMSLDGTDATFATGSDWSIRWAWDTFTVALADGTSFEAGSGGGASNSPTEGLTLYKTALFDYVVDLDAVVSVAIAGVEFPMPGQ